MSTRRLSREYCLKVLYLADIIKASNLSDLSMFEIEKLEGKSVDFAEKLIEKVFENKKSIDEIIAKYAKNWKIERMPIIDRNILRLATCEILFSDTPVAAIIDEAIEIAKKYSTENSGRFVNGILDRIKDERKN